MKKLKSLKILTPILMVVMMLVFVCSGCYMIKGQKMKDVKGTYELSYYSRTNGKTNAVTNYMADYGYKAYLVVTGEGEGFYVYTNDDTAPTYRKVTFTYGYSEEDSSIVEYVTYRFTGTTEEQKVGVNGKDLNFSRPPLKITDTIYSDGLSIGWKKVSKAVDLSYATEQFGELVEYGAVQE